ncbi:MAG: MBL fold metallo-hydrolase [Planctomycetes bacterium]|nr:MBL fold metallo-hydrolase [Planctomycetota bacterium]
MELALRFLGAARHVTGTKHLVEIGERRILLDCGMVQGPRKISNEANTRLAVDAASVDAVVLSHAHIDHSGSLPRLVKLGFEGEIHLTHATGDLAGVLLEDSAQLQAQDAMHLRKRGVDWVPPYDLDDVAETARRFRRHRYHEPFEVLPGVRCEFFDAGHILGSAMVVLTIERGGRTVRLGFTGDHGRKDMPILRDPERLPPLDYLITESTYGDRAHQDHEEMAESLAQIVREEIGDGGRILIPAFSVGRTQNVLYELGNLMAAGRIPRLPVWIDSPLSSKATKITSAHRELFDKEARKIIETGREPFFFDGVRFVEDREESKSLNGVRDGVIIAASGMCEAGRILHHLKVSLPRAQDCVLTVGYMAEGTLGRKLVDGAPEVNVLGEPRTVRCKVRSILGLSAHADWRELCDSLGHLAKTATRVFVVHGEERQALAFVDRLKQLGFRDVVAPSHGQRELL